MIPMLLLSAVLSFQDSQPASRPTYTREEFAAKVETFAAASNNKAAAAEDMTALLKRMEDLKRYQEIDPEGTNKKILGLIPEAITINERSYDAIVDYIELQNDAKFIESIKRYGTHNSGWYGISLGRTVREPHSAIAVLIYDGPPLAAAKLTYSWVDGFGDVVASSTYKLTDIPKLPAKPQPRAKKIDRKYDFATISKMADELPPVTAFTWVVSVSEIPAYVTKPATTTFRLDAVVNVRKD